MYGDVAALAELGAQFRTDVEKFISREAVERVIVPGRLELPKMSGVSYRAFVDPSGGSALSNCTVRNSGNTTNSAP